MKRNLLIASLLAMPFLGNGQVFQENFDGAGPGISAWTLIDVDGLIHDDDMSEFAAAAWITKDRGGPQPNYGGPNNDFAAMSSSYYSPAGTSNDWLISPQIALPGAGTYLQWSAKAQDADFRDGYRVMLAPNGGNTVADFTIELFNTAGENSDWITRTIDLNNYAGSTVRIAFVNNSTDQYVLLVDNISVNLTPTSPPDCPTLVTPADATTGINYLSPVTLTWTAATTGVSANGYDVYLDTNPNPTSLLRNVTTTSTTATGLAASTTYYWKIVSKNAAGDAIGCAIYSFTTAANPYAPYCGPLGMSFTTEPITLVNFAGINNPSPAATAGAPGHENFTSIAGDVTQGGSYLMTLKGNTNGNYDNRFVAFIDWNQNGILDDAGEVYPITTLLNNSTGTDSKQVTQTIVVPADAMLGNTRMRIKKIFGTADYLKPCSGASFGQAEDYSIIVGPLAVSEMSKSQVKVYPNPVVDVLNIEAASKVSNVQVFDTSGKVVSSHILNSVKNQVDLSKLAPGVYIVNIQTEKGTQSMKIVKK